MIRGICVLVVIILSMWMGSIENLSWWPIIPLAIVDAIFAMGAIVAGGD